MDFGGFQEGYAGLNVLEVQTNVAGCAHVHASIYIYIYVHECSHIMQ